uniref:Uncharacterized protein n=1 Tax=candidate division WOR-3 bacterium TaxID=2052148 RepID=A0A7C4TCS8_UNCW3
MKIKFYKLQKTRRVIFLLSFILFLLNCPKRITVKTSQIEVVYLSSLAEDIPRQKPYLAGLKNLRGIKVGYLNFDTPFLPQIFQRLGFYQLLDELSLDFLITNYPLYGYNFLSIPVEQGYGIKNYQGIRFGIFSKNKDSLSIAEQTKLTLVRERSDVLWIIDNKIFSSPPLLINFIIKERILEDTMVSKLSAEPDTQEVEKIRNFSNLLNNFLFRRVYLEGKKLSDYVFSKACERKGANIVLFPKDIVKNNLTVDSLSVADFLKYVGVEKKFKIQKLKKDEVKKISQEKNYSIWGKITKINSALIPDDDGEFLFDIIFY